jgi:ABC-type uncharacterized transport system auxiliary subunit
MKTCMRFLLMAICAFSLSACMPFFSSQPEPAIYALHAAPAAGQKNRQGGHAVAIPEPTVREGFDTNRISLYLYNGRRLDYYKNAVWAERLSKVLQEVLIDTANSLPGMAATSPDSGTPSLYSIMVRVNDFAPVYAAGPEEPPQLRVSLNFRLVSQEGERILADITLSEKARAASNTQTAIVSGLESLLQKVSSAALQKIRKRISLQL